MKSLRNTFIKSTLNDYFDLFFKSNAWQKFINNGSPDLINADKKLFYNLFNCSPYENHSGWYKSF